MQHIYKMQPPNIEHFDKHAYCSCNGDVYPYEIIKKEWNKITAKSYKGEIEVFTRRKNDWFIKKGQQHYIYKLHAGKKDLHLVRL